MAQVTVPAGVARTGPSTSYSRITPLPQGTQARVTGRQGDWLRLDYGGWIRASETQVFTSGGPPRSIIRGGEFGSGSWLDGDLLSPAGASACFH